MTRAELITAIVEEGHYTESELSWLPDEWLWLILTGIDE